MFELILEPLFWLKIIILLLTLSYSIFSAVVFNQIRTMDRVIQLPPTKIIIAIAIFNILLGAFLFLAALVIL